ncbi:HD domain-containing protein [Nocardia puris]|uniref:HD domain-containing protein n=1 Tax=Nocardia puris TaxID=208602 RepID=UPI00189538D5|nr:HD domain-containing protein [Nocardia puris]MBF6368923.1 HD domain-containing protein [Nocardia puris]
MAPIIGFMRTMSKVNSEITRLLEPLTESRRNHTIEVGRKVSSVATLLPDHLRESAIAAGTLHDVGYGYPVLGFHPIDGAVLLEQKGYSRTVCHLVAFHSAATVEAEVRGIDRAVFERFRVGRVPGIDWASDVLWWADMTTGPSGETVTIDERLDDIRDRYEPGSIVRTAISKSEPLLRAAVQRVQESM